MQKDLRLVFKIFSTKCVYKSYVKKKDLALNNLQWLMYCKTKLSKLSQ